MILVPEMITMAKELILRNEYTRGLYEQASEDGRWEMIIQKVYDIGFDNGYEHCKKVGASLLGSYVAVGD